MRYETVVGIEVHAQLMTNTKLFCSCSTKFACEPNHNTCPVCLGLPGVLPVLNRRAVELVLKTAMAFQCEIPDVSRFARKNYYYPDLPKAYQISQYEAPLGVNGKLDIHLNGKTKTIRIHRIHLEEDAGKLIHDARMGDTSYVDYNRVGTPLMEIVSEADISNGDEAVAYLTSLRTILRYIDVCDGNMEEGSMRCEPNISIRPAGTIPFGTKSELKNINSIRAVQRGIEFEVERQHVLIESGGRVIQETRRWDDATQSTRSMRSKETAQDYRYFPDPDLVPVEITAELLESIRKEIPELPEARQLRFINDVGLSQYDAEVLTASRQLADYYETAAKACGDAKNAANWIMTELLGAMNEKSLEMRDCPVSAENFGQLLSLMGDGTLSGRMGKDVFKEMFAEGKSPDEIVKEKNLVQVSDEGAIAEAVLKVIGENPGPVGDFREGKEKAIGFLVGQVMKLTGGKANPQVVNKILRDKLAQ